MRIEDISTKYSNTLESEMSLTSPVHSSQSKVTVVQSNHIICLSIIKNLSVSAMIMTGQKLYCRYHLRFWDHKMNNKFKSL